MQRLLGMLQQAEEYVGTVVEGKLPADPHMGRKVGKGLILRAIALSILLSRRPCVRRFSISFA